MTTLEFSWSDLKNAIARAEAAFETRNDIHKIGRFLLDIHERLLAIETKPTPSAVHHVHVNAHRSGFPPSRPFGDLIDQLQAMVGRSATDHEALAKLGVA